jgi:hypothetical protein
VKFWIPWAIDAVIAGIAVFFFLWGLADGSVSSFNIGLWTLLLGGLAALVAGSLWLRSAGKRGVAVGLLWVLAAPGVLVGVFFLVLIVVNPRWN